MKTKALLIGGIAAATVLFGGWALAQSADHGHGGMGPGRMHGMHGQMGQGTSGMHGPMGHGMQGQMGSGMMRHMGRQSNSGMGPGMMGMGMMGMGGHDAATRAQVGDIHALLANHDRIKRTVTNLPDGIRTVTESDDPQIAAMIKKHVAEMGQRVRAGDDPGLPIESPALRAIFRNKDKIQTSYESTATGIIVTQTSTDPSTVALLQEHAAEVTDLVKGGMAALHTAMMRNHGGMMRGGTMHGGPNAR
jgi:hypothetical protein